MKLKKIRNALLVVLTLALVSATAVAVTWAAVSSENDFGNKTNTFTNNPEIATSIREQTFDSLDYDDDGSVPGKSTDLTSSSLEYKDGTVIADGEDLGYWIARSYTSGTNIPKDPQMRNTTNVTFNANNIRNTDNVTSKEWVAMSVEYKITIPKTYYTLSATQDYYKDGEIVASTETGAAVANGSASQPLTVTAVTSGGYTDTQYSFNNYGNFANTIAKVIYVDQDGHEALENMALGFRVGTTEGDETWKDISAASDPSDKTLFMYNKVLNSGTNGAGDDTTCLFDGVRINTFSYTNGNKFTVKRGGQNVEVYRLNLKGMIVSGTAIANDTYIYVDTLPDFDIVLKGYAVQADEVSYANAPKALRDLYTANK